MIWSVLRIIMISWCKMDPFRKLLQKANERGIGEEKNGLDTNFGGKIETKHESCVCRGLLNAANCTSQFYTPHCINHFIFFCKLCICLSASFSDLHEPPHFHPLGVRNDISPRLGSLPCGFIAEWTLFPLHRPRITTSPPAAKYPRMLWASSNVSLIPDSFFQALQWGSLFKKHLLMI